MKIVISFLCGAALVYAFMAYPKESRKVVQTGVDTASTAIAQGASAASKAADQQLANAKK